MSIIMRITNICFIICIGLFSLISVCSADEFSGYKILLEGGESVLTENEDGSMILTIQNTIPYGVILDDPEYITLLETVFPDNNTIMNAGMIFSTPEGSNISLVQVSNPDYSADTRNLTFFIHPLEFYEGSILADLKDQSENMNPEIVRKAQVTRIFLEKGVSVPENDDKFDRCMNNCEKPGKPEWLICDWVCKQ
ncbi:MAG: hypothetical protein GXY18_05945 [Methanomicrobiales archaeon]|nr:hypothetical protein [Methanomicrobiales archaeon]